MFIFDVDLFFHTSKALFFTGLPRFEAFLQQKKRIPLILRKKEIRQFLSIFGLFQPFFLLNNTTVSTCVDWTQGTGLPIRDTVRKEQVYCIRNMTVQQAKTVHYGRSGCTLITSPACELFLKRARWLNGCSASHEAEVFLHYPDDFFFRGQSFADGHF